jgi:transitional endoplasmic reticulum ATPase
MTPIADNIDIDFIASKTHCFSRANLGFVTQRAVKLAIKQSITHDIERTKECEASGTDAMDSDDSKNLVPKLTKAHFEEAIQLGRRSVSDVKIRRYEAFV